MSAQVFTVSQINAYVKSILDDDVILSDVSISGEISNLKQHSSGHMYFSLKDGGGAVNAAMFKWQRQTLRFVPSNGMRVVARGRMTLYEPTGQYQMVVSSLSADGTGELYAAYERLKEKLESEGLFSPERKKQLPRFPMRIGIITSKTGAAVQDIMNILGRRFPLAEIILCPSAVQGAAAPEELCRAVRTLNSAKCCDVIIIGRGGGSIEDLWAFNDEQLARTIAACDIPVISAVGHETDFTICDFAADLRAPTPSAAAELAVPDRETILETIHFQRERMKQIASSIIDSDESRLQSCVSKSCFKTPFYTIDKMSQRVAMAESRISMSAERRVHQCGERLSGCAARLEALNPFAVLSRGFCTASSEGRLITRAAQLSTGDNVILRFADGTVGCSVRKEMEE